MKISNIKLFKNNNLKKDLQDFFLESDLDQLSNRYKELIQTYQLELIQAELEKISLDSKDTQMFANILIYPHLLPGSTRSIIQHKALDNFFGPYVFLSAIIGLQKQEMNEQDQKYFFIAISRFFDEVRKFDIANDFSALIVDRIVITLLSQHNLFQTKDLYENVVYFLKRLEYSSTHHNLLLSLLRYDPSSFQKLDIDPEILVSVKEDAKNLLKISIKKEKTYQDELQMQPMFSSIPSFQDMERLKSA